MIFAAVGTYCHGFAAMVDAFDRACREQDLDGFAQIGHSDITPSYIAHERFMANADFCAMMGHANLIVCHAGMGIVGEALRTRADIILVPRRARLNADEPTNDQLPFAETVASQYGLDLCTDTATLGSLIEHRLTHRGRRLPFKPASNVSDLIIDALAGSTQKNSNMGHSRP